MTRRRIPRRGRKAVSAMQFDPATYRHHLDRFAMSEAAKLDCMRVVWTFLESELDRLCGGSPEQILLGIRADAAPPHDQDRLDSDDPLASIFNDAAHENAAGKSRR